MYISQSHIHPYPLWFLGCRLYEAYIRCFNGFLTAFDQGSSESPWKRDHSATMGIRTSVTLACFDVVLAMHKYADSDRLYGWIFDQNPLGIDPMSKITTEMKSPDLKWPKHMCHTWLCRVHAESSDSGRSIRQIFEHSRSPVPRIATATPNTCFSPPNWPIIMYNTYAFRVIENSSVSIE